MFGAPWAWLMTCPIEPRTTTGYRPCRPKPCTQRFDEVVRKWRRGITKKKMSLSTRLKMAWHSLDIAMITKPGLAATYTHIPSNHGAMTFMASVVSRKALIYQTEYNSWTIRAIVCLPSPAPSSIPSNAPRQLAAGSHLSSRSWEAQPAPE